MSQGLLELTDRFRKSDFRYESMFDSKYLERNAQLKTVFARCFGAELATTDSLRAGASARLFGIVCCDCDLSHDVLKQNIDSLLVEQNVYLADARCSRAIFLEDETGRVPCKLTEAVAAKYTLGAGTFVCVGGRLRDDGCFSIESVLLPPLPALPLPVSAAGQQVLFCGGLADASGGLSLLTSLLLDYVAAHTAEIADAVVFGAAFSGDAGNVAATLTDAQLASADRALHALAAQTRLHLVSSLALAPDCTYPLIPLPRLLFPAAGRLAAVCTVPNPTEFIVGGDQRLLCVGCELFDAFLRCFQSGSSLDAAEQFVRFRQLEAFTALVPYSAPHANATLVLRDEDFPHYVVFYSHVARDGAQHRLLENGTLIAVVPALQSSAEVLLLDAATRKMASYAFKFE